MTSASRAGTPIDMEKESATQFICDIAKIYGTGFVDWPRDARACEYRTNVLGNSAYSRVLDMTNSSIPQASWMRRSGEEERALVRFESDPPTTG